LEKKFVVSSSPHIKSPESIQTIMSDVQIALIPAAFAGVLFFGIDALIVIVISMVSAMLTEAIILKKFTWRGFLGDGSAAVTGLLLGLIMPASSPWWLVVIGGVVSIAIGKQVFGGIGCNIFNPALVGRAVIFLSWTALMSNWVPPLVVDGTTAATPLAAGGELMPLFLGNVPGCIGETSALAILIGAAYLFYMDIIDWRIPVSYLGTVFILTPVLNQAFSLGTFVHTGLFAILAGGVMFGAIFMATDMVTTPVTALGQLIFGFGCGLLTVVIRLYGQYPEGVTFAILFMNALTPLIDNLTVPRKFGEVKK